MLTRSIANWQQHCRLLMAVSVVYIYASNKTEPMHGSFAASTNAVLESCTLRLHGSCFD